MADQAEPGGAEVLLAAQVWPAVLVPVGILAVLVGTGVWLAPTFPYLPVGLLLSVVVLAWFQRGDALLADETGLLLRHRGRVTRRYRWEEIHQVGLVRPWFAQVALAGYPRGGPWDVPGPNSAVYALLRSRGVRIAEEPPVGRFGPF